MYDADISLLSPFQLCVYISLSYLFKHNNTQTFNTQTKEIKSQPAGNPDTAAKVDEAVFDEVVVVDEVVSSSWSESEDP